MNKSLKAYKVWIKIFFNCDYLEGETCSSSNCSVKEKIHRGCCIFCDERLTCLSRCKAAAFQEYIKGLKKC